MSLLAKVHASIQLSRFGFRSRESETAFPRHAAISVRRAILDIINVKAARFRRDSLHALETLPWTRRADAQLGFDHRANAHRHSAQRRGVHRAISVDIGYRLNRVERHRPPLDIVHRHEASVGITGAIRPRVADEGNRRNQAVTDPNLTSGDPNRLGQRARPNLLRHGAPFERREAAQRERSPVTLDDLDLGARDQVAGAARRAAARRPRAGSRNDALDWLGPPLPFGATEGSG